MNAPYELTRAHLRHPLHDETGASLVEYGLLMAFIALLVTATLLLLGEQVRSVICTVLSQFGGSC